MLMLVNSLFDRLHTDDVIYCHWKSNDAIERGLVGDGDLDVLASQDDAGKFYKILMMLDFKQLTEPPGKAYPGIEHWLGYSEDEGKFVHLHLHFRLVYGEKFIKGYRFFDESGILNRRIFDRGVYQISPADELMFLFIRTIVKVDFVWIIKRIIGKEKQYYPKHILKEYQFLDGKLKPGELEIACNTFLPGIDNDVLIDAINGIDKFNLFTILNWKKTLKKELVFSRRLSKIQFYKIFIKVYALFFLSKAGIKRKAKKQLYSGGVTIALLGADGAGKSTMIGELENWLGYFFEVETVYGGTGEGKKGVILSLFDLLMISRSNRKKKKNDGKSTLLQNSQTNSKSTVITFLKNIRALLIARHRWSTVLKAQRYSNNGKIVLYDRFPQPFQRDYCDGPKAIKKNGVLSSRLYLWEQKVYDKLFEVYVDHCCILMVDPEVSFSRKGEDNMDVISAKNKVLEDIAKRKSNNTIIIDANMEFSEVLSSLKKQVWSWL